MQRLIWLVPVALAFAGGPAQAAERYSGSLDVDQAVHLALTNNYDHKQSESSLALAGANRMNALTRLLPSASGNYTYSRNNSSTTAFNLPAVTTADGNVLSTADFIIDSDQHLNTWGLNLNQNLSLPLFLRLRQAGANIAAARQGVEASGQALAFSVRSEFYLALRAEALLQVQQQDYDLAQNELKRTQTMFELGSVAKADVLKAQVRVSEADVALIRQHNAVELEHARLATLLGFDPRSRFDLEGDLALGPVEIDSTAAVQESLQRPDLLQARSSVRAASLGYKAALTSRIPGLFASFGANSVSGTAGSDRLDQSFDPVENVFRLETRREEGDIATDSWNVRVGASVSLDAFLNIGADRVARASLKTAEYQYEARSLAVQQELEEAILNLRASVSSIASADRGVDAAEEDVRLSRERYEQGLGTILELLQAQVNLTRARYTLVDAQTGLKIAEAQLEKARGVPVGP